MMQNMSSEELIKDINNIFSKKKIKEFKDKQEPVIRSILSKQSQSPQPMDYQLKINTDGSGNNTQDQIITYTTTSVQIEYSSGVPSLSEETANKELTLIGGGDTYPIYEMYFGGFITPGAKNVLLTQVGDYTMFALDAPNTEGIETK